MCDIAASYQGESADRGGLCFLLFTAFRYDLPFLSIDYDVTYQGNRCHV